LLSRGDAPAAGPDDLVEIALVPLARGPLLVSALEAEGLTAVMIEAYNLVTESRTDARIMVPRSQAAAATAIADRLA
jgi:hypothetical protein